MPSPSSTDPHNRRPPSSISIVNRVAPASIAFFDKFLDRRTRALDHLAGGDLVREVIGNIRILFI
jgi:hypothetical protein